MIQPIVEGYGELEAVPILLRRLAEEAGAFGVRIGAPIRQARSRLVHEGSLRRAVGLARRQPGCSAILVVFDGDDDCPRELAPSIERWARDEAGGLACTVVMPHREYEAWFLASIESLRGCMGIRADAAYPPDPESHRGAKEALEGLMTAGRSYHETADQPGLTARFDLSEAYRRSRSFRRLVTGFGTLLVAEGAAVAAWPPTAWITPP